MIGAISLSRSFPSLPKVEPLIPVYAETVAVEPGEPEPADSEPDVMPIAAE